MQSLIKNPKVQKDLENYRSRIDKISVVSIKNECARLLGQLENEIKSIDIAHQELFKSKSLPSMTSDVRQEITSIRKSLDRKLSDVEKARIK